MSPFPGRSNETGKSYLNIKILHVHVVIGNKWDIGRGFSHLAKIGGSLSIFFSKERR